MSILSDTCPCITYSGGMQPRQRLGPYQLEICWETKASTQHTMLINVARAWLTMSRPLCLSDYGSGLLLAASPAQSPRSSVPCRHREEYYQPSGLCGLSSCLSPHGWRYNIPLAIPRMMLYCCSQWSALDVHLSIVIKCLAYIRGC